MSLTGYTTTLLDLKYAEIENINKKPRFMVLTQNHPMKEFDTLLRVLKNWQPYILNAFDTGLSNGFTEGINNSIKALKRTGFGYRSFDHFRKRILLIHNN